MATNEHLIARLKTGVRPEESKYLDGEATGLWWANNAASVEQLKRLASEEALRMDADGLLKFIGPESAGQGWAAEIGQVAAELMMENLSFFGGFVSAARKRWSAIRGRLEPKLASVKQKAARAKKKAAQQAKNAGLQEVIVWDRELMQLRTLPRLIYLMRNTRLGVFGPPSSPDHPSEQRGELVT
jgi:hypothetical protein